VHDIAGKCKRFIVRFNTIQDIVLLHDDDEMVIANLREMKGNGFPSARGCQFLYDDLDINNSPKKIYRVDWTLSIC
jgi:hypothetical protein